MRKDSSRSTFQKTKLGWTLIGTVLATTMSWGASTAAHAEAATTTGQAVTDTEVTVGQLHSATGTMAISETGSIQAERLAIDQINAAAVSWDGRSRSSRRTAPATGRPSPKSPRSC